MTKQPQCATKLRLSRLCRWILTLGVMKLALLTGLLIIPDLDRYTITGSLTALAANPFSTSPERPETESRLERPSVPAFGLAGGQGSVPAAPTPNASGPNAPAPTGSALVSTGSGLTPPAPRINPGQASPFAQPLPE